MRLLGSVKEDPSWVDAILEWRWTWPLARLGLASAYLLGGVVKLSDFSAAVAEQEHFGFHPGWAWAAAAIAVELIGSLLVITGRLVWLGAGALGVLTALATFAASPFWTMQGQARFAATNTFFEHLGLIAGLVIVAILAERDARRPFDRSY